MVTEGRKQVGRVWPRLLEWSVVGGIALSVGILYSDSFYNEHSVAGKTTSVAVTTVTPLPIERVSALGRIEPGSQVIRVAGPEGERVNQVWVAEGDSVQAGQVIARLDSHERLQVAVEQARREVQVAQAQLARVQAGASPSAIAAQEATIRRIAADGQTQQQAQAATLRRLQAEVSYATAEYQRHQLLAQEGAISLALLESKRLDLETRQQQLQEAEAQQARLQTTAQEDLAQAQATLAQIAEVRAVDMQLAQAEVERALAAVQRAETELELAVIRAPQAGEILKIHTRSGEKISENGILELGQTEQMVVVAEVYQTDIGRVQIGQKAQISGANLGDPLPGTVISVGRQVQRQSVFANQPGENLDRRVIEVRIALDASSSQRVAGLTHMQVQAQIEVGS
ncbi:MAG: HlyD family efflux transporter periplasmic adaptor subunit [Cyanobacteriota bacterium]